MRYAFAVLLLAFLGLGAVFLSMLGRYIRSGVINKAGQEPQPLRLVASVVRLADSIDLRKFLLGRVDSVRSRYNEASPLGRQVLDSCAEGARELIQKNLSNGMLGGAGDPISEANAQYAYVLTEDIEHPFQLTPAMATLADDLVAASPEPIGKAKSLFDWFSENVSYGIARRGHVGYRHAREVADSREGVCGEQTILYVVMARRGGLKAKYVSVTEDCEGRSVSHACAAVFPDASSPLLVDPAYHQFGVQHRVVKIRGDSEVVAMFKHWREK